MRFTTFAPLIALSLAACADGRRPQDSPAEAQGTVAPRAEGLYRGDPLAGPDLDPTDGPL